MSPNVDASEMGNGWRRKEGAHGIDRAGKSRGGGRDYDSWR